MKILCTDLEGTLGPEIWQEIGVEFNIKELNLTTRDIPDFDELMQMRMKALSKNKVSVQKIKSFVKNIEPYDGAKKFLESLKHEYQIVIVSDTFYDLCIPLVSKLGNYPILCHKLIIDDDFITGYVKRQQDPKKKVIMGFQSMNYECFCIGDSYNDIQMIDQADGAFIFASAEVIKSRPDIMNFESYNDLKLHLIDE